MYLQVSYYKTMLILSTPADESLCSKWETQVSCASSKLQPSYSL